MASTQVARDSRSSSLSEGQVFETPAISLRLKDERLDQLAEAFIVYPWVGEVSPTRRSRGWIARIELGSVAHARRGRDRRDERVSIGRGRQLHVASWASRNEALRIEPLRYRAVGAAAVACQLDPPYPCPNEPIPPGRC